MYFVFCPADIWLLLISPYANARKAAFWVMPVDPSWVFQALPRGVNLIWPFVPQIHCFNMPCTSRTSPVEAAENPPCKDDQTPSITEHMDTLNCRRKGMYKKRHCSIGRNPFPWGVGGWGFTCTASWYAAVPVRFASRTFEAQYMLFQSVRR